MIVRNVSIQHNLKSFVCFTRNRSDKFVLDILVLLLWYIIIFPNITYSNRKYIPLTLRESFERLRLKLMFQTISILYSVPFNCHVPSHIIKF